MTALGWLQLAVVPDPELLWLWIITFPLTIIWMIWSSQTTKQLFNNAGGYLIFGALALAIVLSFYGPFIGVVLKLFNRVVAALNWGANPSISGGCRNIKSLLNLLALFLMIWIASKIPGLRALVTKVLSFAWTVAGRVWGLHAHSLQNPAWYYQVAGAALIAGALNGRWIAQLTTEMAFPGLIPSASAAVGLFFLLWRTVFGRRLVDRIVHRNRPSADNPSQDTPRAETLEAPAPPVANEGPLEIAQMGDCPHCGELVDLLNRCCTQCGQVFAAEDAELEQPAMPPDEIEVKPMRLQDAWDETF